MVMVHISEGNIARMLRRIRVTLAIGGVWYVNVYPGEGCMMVRDGTEAARRLLHSGSPAIAGPFDALTGRGRLLRAIVDAGQREVRSARKTFPSWGREQHAAYKRVWRKQRRAMGMVAS